MASVKDNESIVSCITTLSEEPFLLLRHVERAAGQLPIEKVCLLTFIPVGLNNNVLVPLSYPLHFLEGLLQFVVEKIVKCRDGDDEVK